MHFKIVGKISDIETIATGRGIRILQYLNETYGKGQWRKLKGNAYVRLPNSRKRFVELHWYEAHGIGKRDVRIKRYLD